MLVCAGWRYAEDTVRLAALRDIVRSALRKAGWANTASARRAHLNPADVLTLHGIPDQTRTTPKHSGALDARPPARHA
jgi:hypothetical protein